MFRNIDVQITTRGIVRFQFAEPLSIASVTVARPDTEEIEWELVSDRFQPTEMEDASFQAWPIDQAPAWALKALEEVTARETKRLETRGPYLPVKETLAYGEVPPGYREDLPAKPLAPGRHTLTVFAEQGTVSAFFEVPVA